MAAKTGRELSADTAPARTRIVPTQAPTGSAEFTRSTVAQFLAQAIVADLSDATANAKALLTAADYAAMRTLLSLVPGTNVQAYSAVLAALAAQTDLAIADGGTGQSTAYAAHDALSVKGSDIASATTTDIGAGTGLFVTVTGTTTITGFGTKTAGVFRIVRFSGVLTLTYNASSLILPTAANITTAANDMALMVSEGSGNWRCVSYLRADGRALVAALAASVPFNPTGTLSSTNVQAALEEIDTDVGGKASSIHSHSTSDVTGLDTALAAKGRYNNIRTVTTTGDITSTDALGLVLASGTSITLTFQSSGFVVKDWVDIRNENADTGSGTKAISISFGSSEDVDASGTNTILLAPGDQIRIVRIATSGEPQWKSLGPQGYLAVGANQYERISSDGTTREAVTDIKSGTVRIYAPTDGMCLSVYVPYAATLVSVKHRVSGGSTATCQAKKNGTNTTGFSSAVAMATTTGSVSVGDSFAAGDYLTIRLATTSGLSADADSLKWVDLTPVFTRTGA